MDKSDSNTQSEANSNNNSNLINDEIFAFMQSVIIGIENKVYSTLKESTDKLKTQEGMLNGMNYMELYLNQLYKLLVDKSDDFICEKFSLLGKSLNLHPVYTLNLITNIIMRFYPLLTRSKLNIDSLGDYATSVISVTNTMKKYMMHTFNEELKKLINKPNENSDSESIVNKD